MAAGTDHDQLLIAGWPLGQQGGRCSGAQRPSELQLRVVHPDTDHLSSVLELGAGCLLDAAVGLGGNHPAWTSDATGKW
jgi:hypothetical protein